MPNKTWATNDVVTASDLNTQYRDQVVTTCTSATRPSGTEGQHIYETDTDREYIYSGSGWVEYGGIGAWISFTPTVTQSVAVTKTVTYAKYFKMGRHVTASVSLSLTSTGTANNAITITLPFTAATSALYVGVGDVYDSSGTSNYPGIAYLNSTTTVVFLDTTQNTNNVYLGQNTSAFAVAVASGDILTYTVNYESTT